jgi:hypothetical protein
MNARAAKILRDPWLAALALLAAVQYAFLAPRLLYPDPALGYPFLGGDSFSWLLSALELSGEPVRQALRPPALPLVLAGLSHFGLLSIFPVLGLAFQHAAALGAHVVLRSRFGRAAAFVAGLLVLFGTSVLNLAFQVMADLPAAILLGASCAAFLAAGRRPGRYELAGLLGGLSAVTQQAALLLPLPMAITVLAFRRDHLRRFHLWLGAAAFAAFPAAWFVAKKLMAGTFFDAGLKQWGLLGFQPQNVPYYLVAAVSFWGWPALLLAVAGAVSSVRFLTRRTSEPDRSADEAAWALFPLLTVAVLVLFFALFYDFLAKRFLVYAFFPALALVARALSRLAGSRALPPVAVLTVVIAAWPLGNPDLPSRAALHNPVPRWSAARLDVVDWATVARRSLWSRVLRAARNRPSSRPPAVPVPDDTRVAIYVLGSGPREPSRYDSLTRLGCVTRRIVTLVPPELYPEGWWGWRGLEPLGISDRFRLFGWRPLGAPSAIVAFGKSDPRGRRLARRARAAGGPASPGPVPRAGRIRKARRLARRVGALVPPGAGPAIVLPEVVGEWTRFLPLFMSRAIVIADSAAADRLRKREENCQPATRVGRLEVARCRTGPITFELVRSGT